MDDRQQRPPEVVTYSRAERSRDEVVLVVEGPLYDEVADEFQRQLDGAVATGRAVVTLDLKRVKVIASKPLGKIVFVMKRLQETNRTLRIRGCSPELWRDFTSVRFERIIDIEP